MIARPLPPEFVIGHGQLGWTDAVWGVEHGWIDSNTLIALAINRLQRFEKNPQPELELAALQSVNHAEAFDLAKQLARTEPSAKDPKSKWLYLVSRWVFEHRDQVTDPLGIMEELYADFEYPSELAPLIRYMPPIDGYDPAGHTRQENESRLFDKWREYLADAEKRHFTKA